MPYTSSQKCGENLEIEINSTVQFNVNSTVMHDWFLFDLIFDIPSTIFQLNRDGSSWVELG